jgi:antitoxin HigA-1
MPSDIFPEDAGHPGPALAVRRHAEGLTRSQLGDAIDITGQFIADVEHRRRGISLSLGLRLSAYFGDPPFYWVGLQRDYEVALAYRAALPVLETIRAARAAQVG